MRPFSLTVNRFCYKYVYRGIYGGCRTSPDIKSKKRRIPWTIRRKKTLRFLTQLKTGTPSIKSGIADPQVLFMGIGDHECDQAPLQIGQFESSDDLLNKWLTGLWLEGGGGANEGESYSLPWYMAAKTMTDHFQKRGKKGVLITIGDEPVLKSISRSTLDLLFGGQNQDMTAAQMLELAEKTYEVFHIHLSATRAGSLQYVKDGWKQLMGDKVKFAETKETVERVIVDIIKTVFVSQTESTAPSGELDAIAAEQAAESVDPMVPGTCPGVKPSKTEEPPRIKY